MKYSNLILVTAFLACSGMVVANAERTAWVDRPIYTEVSEPMTDVTLKDRGNMVVVSYTNSKVSVEGKTNLFISGTKPLINSTVDLVGDDAWLYITAVRPSVMLSNWVQYVTVNGRAFDEKVDRIAIYASGAVVIPNGKKYAEEALTVYTGKNYTGDSKSFEINTYHNNLGEFDNKIQSFKLRKGFAATLANNPDGTGFSRMFIASDDDIEISEMPEGMEKFVSFIRVFKWEWTAKKGWAGGASDQLNVSINYDWDAAGDTENMDMEYVPMRHNLGWQSFEVINARNNVSHLLGYNEPDRPDQADMTIDHAIEQWPEFFKSGLRLGSPAPSSAPHSWLTKFMAICDSLNYRVDFVVSHAYQNQATSWWDWNIGATSSSGGNRPVWITEWNNGANWTTENWPTASGPKRDADLNIVYDENGAEQIVNRPLSPENSARSKEKMEQVLPFFESCDLLEHHFLYNWVQDARSMMLDDKLTPAGKYFAALNSQVGFKKSNEYIHKWKIAPPFIVTEISDDYKNFNLKWYDHNGETGKNYVLQRKIGNGEFKNLKIYTANEDYHYADTLKFTDPIENDNVTYRVFAVSYKDMRSIYSRNIIFKRDVIANPPALSGNAVSATILHLTWNVETTARSYRLERAESADGEYEIIADFLEGSEFIDKDLADNTDYYYRIYSLNTGGVGVASAPFRLKTKEMVTPSAITGLRAASGDRTVTLTWDFVYDALYDVLRSDTENGEYEVIASDVEMKENDARYKDTYELSYGKTYYYKLIPHNKAGEGAESGVVSATPQVGQYLHLTFDEGTGTTVYDNWGGYHAEFQDKPIWKDIAESGSTRPAVFLDKTAKSHLLLPKGVVSTLTDEFTIASWLYLPEDQGNNTRMFDFGSGTGTFMVFIPKYSQGTARYKLTYPREDGTQAVFQPTFNYNFPLGEWAHVAFTVGKHPQGGLLLMVYLNGKLVAFDRDLESLVPAGMGYTETNYLGRSQWPADPYCSHGYKDFRIYNTTLTAANIKELYEGKEPELKPTGMNEIPSIPTGIMLTVAPNPVFANESVEVHVANMDAMPKDITLGLYDMMGNLIAQRRMNCLDATITAPGIAGIYIVKVSSGGFSQSAKLIVK
ncbi:glycosyl hydrolase [Bacteroides sp.]